MREGNRASRGRYQAGSETDSAKRQAAESRTRWDTGSVAPVPIAAVALVARAVAECLNSSTEAAG